MTGPLDGVRVIEISMFQQGPVAGMRLGDLGADVIKIEPKTGDPGRQFMRIIGAMVGLEGRNYYFEHGNRNKRGMVLDMRKPQGMEVFLKLVDSADVFLNNMSIPAPERMGIGPDVLMARNPRLIYAHASGWGRKGPDADDYSFDYTGIARSGLMFACGEKGAPPTQILPGIGDEVGALACAWGVTAALYAREKTGRGQVVDTSLMGSVIATLGLIMAAPSMLDMEFSREVRAEAGNPIYNHYRCQDDRWIAIAHLQPERYWPKVCQALSLEELTDDPRFNSIEARSKNAAALVAIFDERFALKPRHEWLALLNQAGCICTPVQTPQEVTCDPQALANDYFVYMNHPEHGKTKMVGFPWDFSDTPASCRLPAPEFGQHTDEILSELGYTAVEIDSLRRNEVI
ncbi:CaiB/BaiF CoA transferase family protein [Desulfomonile tiedjei]|uniref:Putative acyl-CoA transferase/carnitine dehydratase n=1 Tax=Desulfomonile tiedjei (strain ATCC 49306 / DSM 6799 / DCB-1) TaxID=706587 RepID=I4C9M6_DESTA|nr:CoA transferase [Desulfomonile tiedjei]AFM26267.1 putative acyl-CoA transferase/carnitine dehydratase [Desulfomonile tiedjei DSM 6799]